MSNIFVRRVPFSDGMAHNTIMAVLVRAVCLAECQRESQQDVRLAVLKNLPNSANDHICVLPVSNKETKDE